MHAPLPARRPPLRIALTVATLAAALASVASASSGVAFRVEDLNPSPGDVTVYDIQPFASTGELALAWGHVANRSGSRVWVTDGTAAGTRRLRDLSPIHPWWPSFGAAAVGGGVIFPADSPGTGNELWWTDGTLAGTRLVRDIRPGRRGSNPFPVGVLSGLYLFIANDGVHGCELWKSDGTEVGTRLLADIRPGPEGSCTADDLDVAGGVLNGRFFFSADDGVHGPELWRTDGHPAGTYLLKSLIAGAAGGNPKGFRVAGGRLLFAGTDATHGRELWATDGSAAGTVLVGDLRPGSASSAPEPFESLPGRALLSADDGTHGRSLWVSDGTAERTWQLAAIRPGFDPEQQQPLAWSGRIGARAVFAASDGSEVVAWTSDGTVAGTMPLCGALPPGVACREPQGFAPVAGGLVFTGWNADYDYGIWRTDGTPAGTTLLAEQDGGYPVVTDPAVPAGGAWVLAIYRTYCPGPSCTSGRALWRTDGTAGGTVRVDVLGLPQSPSSPRRLTARSSGIVFGANSYGVYRSDGTGEGTAPVEYPGAGELQAFSEAALLPDGELLFDGRDSELGEALFRTEGDAASLVAWLVAFNLRRAGDLVFFASTDPQWCTLWRSDGTAAGTFALGDFLEIMDPTDVFGRAWFGAPNLQGDLGSLWESAGTVATTVEHPLEEGLWSAEDAALAIVPLDSATGAFSFQASEGLYRFDPASGQASRFRSLSVASNGVDLAVLDGRLLFFDEEPDRSCSLWASDGTTAGTSRVKTWASGFCFATQMVRLGGRVYFAACDLAAGCELWKSDGTESGTVRVKDIDPGMFSSTPAFLTPVGDRLYFVACDGPTGCEPWVSDGTGRGTHRVSDIAPGPGSSLNPLFRSWEDSTTPNLTRWTRLVFLAADDGTGTELWAMPIEIFYDGFETGDASRWDPPTDPFRWGSSTAEVETR